MSGRLKGIVLSVSMLRFQYSLKFSFSSTVHWLVCTYNMDFYRQSIRLLLPVLLLLLLLLLLLFYSVLSGVLACFIYLFI